MSRLLTIILCLTSSLAFAQPAELGDEPINPEDPVIQKDEESDEDQQQELSDQELRRRLRGEQLEDLSRTELEQRGFVFQDQNQRRDDSTALILALTAGLGVHGIGHLYLGDKTTGSVLVGAEVLSLLMMTGAGVAYIVTGGSSRSNSIIAPIFDSGLALFVYSYLVDVAGSVAGPELAFPRQYPRDRNIVLSTMYGFTSSRGSPVRHALRADVEGDFRFLTFDAGTIQDLFLETSLYTAGAYFRPFKFLQSRSEIVLGAHLDYVNHSGRGPFGRLSADGRLIGTLDLGDLFTQLEGFAFTIEAGYGNRWWSFANEDNVLEVQLQQRYAPFDFRASAWLTPKLYVEGGYGTPQTPFVANVSRILGVSHLEFRYQTSSIVDLRVRGELGDGFSSWIGAGISPF